MFEPVNLHRLMRGDISIFPALKEDLSNHFRSKSPLDFTRLKWFLYIAERLEKKRPHYHLPIMLLLSNATPPMRYLAANLVDTWEAEDPGLTKGGNTGNWYDYLARLQRAATLQMIRHLKPKGSSKRIEDIYIEHALKFKLLTLSLCINCDYVIKPIAKDARNDTDGFITAILDAHGPESTWSLDRPIEWDTVELAAESVIQRIDDEATEQLRQALKPYEDKINEAAIKNKHDFDLMLQMSRSAGSLEAYQVAYDQIDNEAYGQGYDQGYEQGEADGYEKGYQLGLIDGHNDAHDSIIRDSDADYESGYGQGYIDGMKALKEKTEATRPS